MDGGPSCKIDGAECTEPAKWRFVWAWGEEGFCCDSHRLVLLTRCEQLGRSLSLGAIGPYAKPELRELGDDANDLRLKLAVAQDVMAKQAARIQELEAAHLRDADTPAE